MILPRLDPWTDPSLPLSKEVVFGPDIHLSLHKEGTRTFLHLQGPSGAEASLHLPDPLRVILSPQVGELRLEVGDCPLKDRKRWLGTYLALLRQKEEGLRQGFKSCLKLVGVGYRASLPESGGLLLRLGYSHEVLLPLSSTLEVICPNPTTIFIKGQNLQEVTQKAADIRGWRLPEPYKGKGIFYQGETVLRKEGKKN